MDDSSKPFDEFGHNEHRDDAAQRGRLSRWMRTGLRAISFVGLLSAFSTAIFIVILHTFRAFGGIQPIFLPTLKSAIPLIAIGISYISLIFTIRRTGAQRVLGVLVGLAFVLWGTEQFMNDKDWISYIDDIIVFLFVLDLSIVVRENLLRLSGERRVRQLPIIKAVAQSE